MNRYIQELEQLKENRNYRRFPSKETEELMDLCSNDYLGINSNTELRERFYSENSSDLLFSSCSSRLLGKPSDQHLLFENEIASAFEAETALLFNSGYHANSGIIPAVAGKKDLILADKLVHASIIDGALLSKADLKRYRHLDYDHLEKLLQEYRERYDNVFIISESIFSMDGDVADIQSLVEIKKKHNALLYIDEAHALGVRGNNGLGCIEEQECISEVDFIVGTLGKAMASVGAFLVSRQVFKDYLINHSRTLIYSTAIPPINIAWSRYIFNLLPEMKDERSALQQVSQEFCDLLEVKSESHIIPYIIGSNADAIEKSEILKDNGFNVLPIRYPTVPKNTARLRFTLSAGMNIEELTPIKKLLS